jgi:hypothetical protein
MQELAVGPCEVGSFATLFVAQPSLVEIKHVIDLVLVHGIPPSTINTRYKYQNGYVRSKGKVRVDLKLGSGHVGSGEVGVSEVCFGKVGPVHFRVGEVCSGEGGFEQDGIGEVGVSQIGSV